MFVTLAIENSFFIQLEIKVVDFYFEYLAKSVIYAAIILRVNSGSHQLCDEFHLMLTLTTFHMQLYLHPVQLQFVRVV